MNKLKMIATTTLAATTIGVGGLVASPSASAKPMSCDRAMALAQAYIVIGQMLYNNGDYTASREYTAHAQGLMQGACGG
jgi:hypothetical protein